MKVYVGLSSQTVLANTSFGVTVHVLSLLKFNFYARQNYTRDAGNMKLPFYYKVKLSLCSPGHFAGEDVKAKLAELHGRWETLKGKAAQRRQDLEDSLQAQQYFADANEAESWMREKEPIVGSTDYGKDEDSAEVSVERCVGFWGFFLLFFLLLF